MMADVLKNSGFEKRNHFVLAIFKLMLDFKLLLQYAVIHGKKPQKFNPKNVLS